jgi:cellulose synthase/poly-beta-1,6-N-acetylglucosamine synthase-like glycosyltransferase
MMSSGWLIWAGFLFSLVVVAELLRLNFLLYEALRKELKLPDSGDHRKRKDLPRVTVIVPAKDEETTIQQTAKSILASDYDKLDLILVNDRSTDRTLEMMEHMARQDPRIRVVCVEELPSGWTGKTHAMFHGTACASGEILLFTDADAMLEMDVISRSVDFMLCCNLDALGLLPGFLERGFIENAVHPHLALGLSSFYPLTDVNDANKKAALASGCFLMLRREAYEAVGGWKNFRDQITEDIALSKAVKQKGLRLKVLRGGNMVRTKPFDGLAELAGFWTRTFTGGLEKSILKMMKLCLNYVTLIVLLGIFIASGAAVASGGADALQLASFVISGVGTAVVMISYGIVVKKEHGSAWYGFSAPLGLFLGGWIAVRSFVTVLTNRGIPWRGTLYK